MVCTDSLDRLHVLVFNSGTHDIQNLSVVAISSRIIVRGHFLDKSEAEGLLVIVYNIHDPDLYPPQYHLIPRSKSGSKGRKLKFELIRLGIGEVSISVFVVENNGLPFPQVVARPSVVYIPNSSSELKQVICLNITLHNYFIIINIIGNASQQPFALIEYSIQSNTNVSCITCNFKQNSSATGCLVVVHQRISQANLSGLMSIEANWTRRFTRHGDTASGCIPGLDLELYQVGVADGKQVSGTFKGIVCVNSCMYI